MQPAQQATFFVGLARWGREVDTAGHKRQLLRLEFSESSGVFANAENIAFDPALQPYGFINGLAIGSSVDGPVIAVCPLVLPMNIGAGAAATFAPGTIIMNRKSLESIRGIRPIEVS